MDALLRELLDVIDLHKDKIADAARQFGLSVEVSFGVYLDGNTPACLFSCDTINRLAALRSGLDIDLTLVG